MTIEDTIKRKNIPIEVKFKALIAIEKMRRNKEYAEKVNFVFDEPDLGCVFIWGDTDEGHDFWEAINDADNLSDDTIITESGGGKQSPIEGKMTEVPPIALIEVSKVMGLGSVRYPREADGSPNWHKIGCESNLDHALLHIANYLEERNNPDRDENYMLEELSHFAARAMMALEMFVLENNDFEEVS